METKNNKSSGLPPDTAAQKINKFIEKFAVWIVTILISIGGTMYTKMDNKIEVLEDRVSHLYQDKVSRAELREEMALLRNSQALMKDDIIQRLELIMRMLPSRNTNP